MLGFYLFNDTFPTHSPEPPSPPELQPAPLEQHLTMVQNYTKDLAMFHLTLITPPKKWGVSDLNLHTHIGSTIGQGLWNVKQKNLFIQRACGGQAWGAFILLPQHSTTNQHFCFKKKTSSARWTTQLDISQWLNLANILEKFTAI